MRPNNWNSVGVPAENANYSLRMFMIYRLSFLLANKDCLRGELEYTTILIKENFLANMFFKVGCILEINLMVFQATLNQN